MATTFCTQCGAKHEYSGFAPNFCSKCGSGMGAKGKQPSEKAKTSISASENEDDDEGNDIQELPELDKLDVEIEMEGGFRVFNLEELAQKPSEARAKKFSSRRVSGIDGLSPTKYGSTKD